MPFSARQTLSRGFLPALLAALILTPLLSGCGEDRSNLIPADTADSLILKFEEVESLAKAGKCFEAAPVAAEAQQEIESMSTEIDPRLKRSLLDGVTELTVLVNNPEVCIESEADTTEEPTETGTDPEGTTGETGTTDSGTTTTGDQGPTTDEQDPEQPQGNGNGNQTPTDPPATNPTSPTNPNTPSGPGSGSPGSGGVGPG